MKKVLLLAVMLSVVCFNVASADVVIPEVLISQPLGLNLDIRMPLYHVDANPLMYDWQTTENLFGFETNIITYPSKAIPVFAWEIPANCLSINVGGAGVGVPTLTLRDLFPYAGINLNILKFNVPDTFLLSYVGIFIMHDNRIKDDKVINSFGFKASKKIW
jgi:hypothetical protein